MQLGTQAEPNADAQPDRHQSAEWGGQIWQNSSMHFVDRLDEVHTQWQLYEIVKFEYLAQLFPSTPGTTSLECGCGSAGVSAFFAKHGYETNMLDFAPGALQLASRNFGANGLTGRFTLADMHDLPYRNDSF